MLQIAAAQLTRKRHVIYFCFIFDLSSFTEYSRDSYSRERVYIFYFNDCFKPAVRFDKMFPSRYFFIYCNICFYTCPDVYKF